MSVQPATSDPRCRRRSQRVRVGLPARLWLDVGWQQVICEDFSDEGAGLVVFKPELRDLLIFPAQSRQSLRITLQLPDGDVDVRGRLVHRGPDRVGVRFSRMSPETRARLDRAIERRA